MTDSRRPLMTVVVPTCDRNDLLALCLNRLAPGAQSLSAGEYTVVVTDDGSRTTAEALVRGRYPWAEYLPGPRRGPGANRNAGAARAKGEWIVFTDDDCLPAAGWLAAFAASIRPGTRVYEGRTTCEAGVRPTLEHAPVNETGGWLWSCNMMVWQDCFRELGGFDEEFPHPHMEDVDFRERLLGAGYEFVFVPEAVVDHPPRPVKTGLAMARTHESEFMFYYKSGKTRSFLLQHARRVAVVRLREIARSPDGGTRLAGLKSLAVELAYLASNGPTWERAYRRRYAGSAVPYRADLSKRVGMR